MLADQFTQLLTAFVDGELSQRERKAVTRLLHRSSEAREILRQLQENAHKVKQLPRRKLNPSLVNDVLQAITEQGLQPKHPVRAKVRPRRWLPYVAASLAASVMIGAIGILYWKSMSELEAPNADRGAIIATHTNTEKKTAQTTTEKKSEQPPAPEPPPRKAPNPLLAQMVDETFRGFIAPVPLEQAFTASFRELQREGATTSQLAHELNREKAIQLDITVKNNAVAMERLKSAFHDRGIKVAVDPSANKSLKSKARVEYWVYAENLTSSELSKMLQELSLNDTTGKKNEASPYQKIASLTPIAMIEKQKLSRLLGVESTKIENPADRIEGDKTPKAGRWDRMAVVLLVKSGAQPSEEVRQFTNQLRRPSAGTVQVLIKIHQD